MRTQVALLVACAASANAFSPSAPGLAGARRAGVAYVSGRQPFVPAASPGLQRTAATELDMFGWLKEAFANEAYAPPAEGVKATARHILVKNLEDINEIKARLDSGATTFEDAARDFSTCPSSREGGSLGSFKPGMMVAEFDQVRPAPAQVHRAHILVPFPAIGYAQTSRVTVVCAHARVFVRLHVVFSYTCTYAYAQAVFGSDAVTGARSPVGEVLGPVK